MKQRVENWVDSFSNRLPDLRGVPRQKQAAIGLGVSVLIHVAILLVAGLVAWFVPDQVLAPAKKTEEVEEKTVEIELVADPELLLPPVKPEEVKEKTVKNEMVADPELLLPPVKPGWKAPKLVPLQADGLMPTERAPDRPVFQASQNMVAASERTGHGTDPVPSQDGLTLPFRQFKNQSKSLVVREIPIGGGEQTVPAGVPEVGSAGSSGSGDRMEKSGATDGNDEKELRASEDPDALLLPARRKEPVGQQSADPSKQGEKGESGKAGQQAGGNVSELYQTRVEGSISNRGAPGVDAVKTPLGEYRQHLNMQIGSRWHYHVRKLMDFVAIGTVRVRFYVTREGRVQDLRILESSSNQTFVEVCERSVREAEIAPPPPEVELMNDGRMEMVFNFTIF